MSCIHGPKNQSWPQYFETYEVIGAITSFMERCLHLYLCLFVLYDSLAFFIPRSILKCIERSSRMRSSRSSIHSVSHSSPKSQPKMEICFHSLRDCAVRQKFFTSQRTTQQAQSASEASQQEQKNDPSFLFCFITH